MAKEESINQVNDILEVSFARNQFRQSLESYKYVLDAYKKGQPKALALNGDTPIFLDTNVLLSVYEVSFKARDKIKQFVAKYKNRIVLTSQVQHEYIKNREKVINTFQTTVTEQIPKNFKNEVFNKFTTFKNVNKSKLEDYVDIQTELENLEKNISQLFEKISEEVDDKKDLAEILLLEDDFLDVLSTLKVTKNFSEKQLKSIRDDYDALLPKYKDTQNAKSEDEDKSPNKENYSLAVFPGCGEKGNKDDPKGDFIIYHELMQFARDSKNDLIFLTNDTTKGDWLRKDGKIHIHYLENFYHNTGQLIYIINAERLFAELFKDISFKSLVSVELNTSNLTVEEIYNFLESYEPLKRFKPISEQRGTISKELLMNGISTIADLQIALDKTKSIVDLIYNQTPYFNKLGAMRACLSIQNPEYIKINPKGEFLTTKTDYGSIRKLWKASRTT